MVKDGKTLSKYKDIISSVCKVKDFKYNPDDPESDCCLGIAMVLAFMRGTDAELEKFSKYLELDLEILEKPFSRLKTNGVFGNKYNARNNRVLKGLSKRPVSKSVSAKDLTKLSWAHVAGIAGGFVGIRSSEDIKKIEEE